MGDGEQENGIWLENRKRDAARGDGEQENGEIFFFKMPVIPGSALHSPPCRMK